MKRRILPLVVGARARSGVGLSAASIVASIAAGLALLAPLSGREAALAAGPSACQPRRFQLSGDFSLLAERPKSRAPTEQQTGEHASVAPLDHPAKSRAPTEQQTGEHASVAPLDHPADACAITPCVPADEG